MYLYEERMDYVFRVAVVAVFGPRGDRGIVNLRETSARRRILALFGEKNHRNADKSVNIYTLLEWTCRRHNLPFNIVCRVKTQFKTYYPEMRAPFVHYSSGYIFHSGAAIR